MTLGRWAGVFVLGSALFMGAWQFFGFFEVDRSGAPLRFRIFGFWGTLVSVGSSGVIIILLAELINMVRGDNDDYEEDGDGVQEDDG